jgi:serine/threonine protein kinase
LTTGVGTLRFTAPEQLQGKGQYGLKVDNYSCGIVLIEMFRDHDVGGRVIQEIINWTKIGKVEPEIAKKMPSDVVVLIEQLIQKTPDFRPDILTILTSEILP